MTRFAAEAIAQCDPIDISVDYEYSGRGMYGKTTCAVIAPSALYLLKQIGSKIEWMARECDCENEILELANAMTQINNVDNMGKNSFVFY